MNLLEKLAWMLPGAPDGETVYRTTAKIGPLVVMRSKHEKPRRDNSGRPYGILRSTWFGWHPRLSASIRRARPNFNFDVLSVKWFYGRGLVKPWAHLYHIEFTPYASSTSSPRERHAPEWWTVAGDRGPIYAPVTSEIGIFVFNPPAIWQQGDHISLKVSNQAPSEYQGKPDTPSKWKNFFRPRLREFPTPLSISATLMIRETRADGDVDHPVAFELNFPPKSHAVIFPTAVESKPWIPKLADDNPRTALRLIWTTNPSGDEREQRLYAGPEPYL